MPSLFTTSVLHLGLWLVVFNKIYQYELLLGDLGSGHNALLHCPLLKQASTDPLDVISVMIMPVRQTFADERQLKRYK